MIDAYRFRIIRDSWQKTDKRDAANLSLALWLASRSGEMRLPEVRRPGPVVRELRRLFGLYELLNKQIRQLKRFTGCCWTTGRGIVRWASALQTIPLKHKSF